MHFSTSLALLALSSGALAQLQITDSVGISVLQVLATAIPPESISQATADPLAFSRELESSLDAGNTPSWYQALPSDVKSYLPQLYPAETTAETTSSAYVPIETASSTPSSASITSNLPTISAMPSSGNSSAITTVSMGSPTQPAGGEETSETTGVPSTGGAALPTGMVGAGAAAAIGFLGMLAL